VRALTNLSAEATDRYFYDAYGRSLEPGGTTLNDHLFAGEVFDALSETYYLRAREYDQTTGRFISTDVFVGFISAPDTLHRYVYVGADPVNHLDPSGMLTVGELNAVTVGIGILAGLAFSAFTGAPLVASVAIGVGAAFTFRFAFGAALLSAATAAPALPSALPRASDTASRVITTLQNRGGGTISNEATTGLQAANRALTDASVIRAGEIIAKDGAKFPTTPGTIEFYRQVLAILQRGAAEAGDEITDLAIKQQAVIEGLIKAIESSELI
jgi:RHS repeat-associated protein